MTDRKEQAELLVVTAIKGMRYDAPFDTEKFLQSYLEDTEYMPTSKEETELVEEIVEVLDSELGRYNPTGKELQRINAPIIPVTINGKIFKTFIDDRGVQRFYGSAVMRRIVNEMNDPHGKLSLNTLMIDYYNGMFSCEEWLDFMTSYGYSVSGLLSMSEFQYLPVENPLWEE